MDPGVQNLTQATLQAREVLPSGVFVEYELHEEPITLLLNNTEAAYSESACLHGLPQGVTVELSPVGQQEAVNGAALDSTQGHVGTHTAL